MKTKCILININISSGEQNQRALVGREALVNPGADLTADDAINNTRRYGYLLQ